MEYIHESSLMAKSYRDKCREQGRQLRLIRFSGHNSLPLSVCACVRVRAITPEPYRRVDPEVGIFSSPLNINYGFYFLTYKISIILFALSLWTSTLGLQFKHCMIQRAPGGGIRVPWKLFLFIMCRYTFLQQYFIQNIYIFILKTTI